MAFFPNFSTAAIMPIIAVAVLLASAPEAGAENSKLFREYIGAQGTGVKFTDVPIPSDLAVHFILAFAIDYTAGGATTDGNFAPYWDTTNLSPSAVLDIKNQHPNVKVAVSLAGYSLPDGQLVYFTASSVSSWVSNAVASLTAIIQEYNLDGVDVDYEHFTSDQNTFVECIGQLLTQLKNNGVISFASIAPYEDDNYQALWAKYSQVIDYINYQFYGYPNTTTAAEYVSYYAQQQQLYPGGTILASLQTAPGDVVPPATAIDAFRTLQSEDELYGIFIWSADSSLSQGFTYEKQAQAILEQA